MLNNITNFHQISIPNEKLQEIWKNYLLDVSCFSWFYLFTLPFKHRNCKIQIWVNYIYALTQY